MDFENQIGGSEFRLILVKDVISAARASRAVKYSRSNEKQRYQDYDHHLEV